MRTRLPGPAISHIKYLCPNAALLLAACDPSSSLDVTMYRSLTGPPSSAVMALSAAPDNKVMGAFCQPDFLEGKYSVRGDTLAFAAVTAGGEALCSHSGRFVEGQTEGQTLSHGCDFLMIWVATRRAEEVPPAP